jgi:Predicted phosphohydrolases
LICIIYTTDEDALGEDMCKIGILHLSDLHLTSNQKELDDKDVRNLKKQLIKSINNIKKENEINVVAVTGDVINKGKVKDYSFVKEFFMEISEETQIALNKFIFTPGNHDVKRDKFIRTLDIREMDEYTSFKNHFLGRFSDFCKFYKELTNDTSSISYDSYGIKDIEIDKRIIRFIVINSSLCTNDNQDFMKLVISKHQLESIGDKIRNTETDPILTIALMHHPIQWLDSDEQEQLLEYFEDEFNVNILLHGHTHEGRVYGNMDIDRTLINFVTGIGYDKNEKENYKKLKYRIAYYNFDTDKNIIEGKLLVTNDKLRFVPDTSKYRKINVNGYFSLNYPLNNINKLNLYNQYFNSYEPQSAQNNIDLIDKVSILEKMIYDGKKYFTNHAFIKFNTKEKKYELKFKKRYEIIGDEPSWYSGQFYGNKYKNNPQRSKEFYDKYFIKWEDLKFRAFVKVLDQENEVIQSKVEVLVECVAESSNYKTFNIKYINKRLNTNLNVHKGNIIELEYSYEIPVFYWGSYLNRTISYFKEIGDINISCDEENRLNCRDLFLTKPPKIQISKSEDFVLQDNGSFLIKLPNESGKYTLYWSAKDIFGIDEEDTAPSKDECQITNT